MVVLWWGGELDDNLFILSLVRDLFARFLSERLRLPERALFLRLSLESYRELYVSSLSIGRLDVWSPCDEFASFDSIRLMLASCKESASISRSIPINLISYPILFENLGGASFWPSSMTILPNNLVSVRSKSGWLHFSPSKNFSSVF